MTIKTIKTEEHKNPVLPEDKVYLGFVINDAKGDDFTGYHSAYADVFENTKNANADEVAALIYVLQENVKRLEALLVVRSSGLTDEEFLAKLEQNGDDLSWLEFPQVKVQDIKEGF